MQTKKSSLSDLPKIVPLFDQYRVWYGKQSDLNAAHQFLSERLEKEESVIFLAEDEQGHAAGFTQLYPLFSSTRMQRLWLLNDLFVHADYRGRGISKLLIEAAKNHCRKTGGCAVTLETQKSNGIGNNLYPATDFKLDREHNFYEWEVDGG